MVVTLFYLNLVKLLNLIILKELFIFPQLSVYGNHQGNWVNEKSTLKANLVNSDDLDL